MKNLKLSVLCGFDKSGKRENFSKLDFKHGEIIGIVGPTGSGKSTLINDIEQLASGDTFSRRHILINGKQPPLEMRTNPLKRIVAQLSQNMHFLTDMGVAEFLDMHAHSRGKERNIVSKVIKLANTLCGEEIHQEHNLTILSGGQSRALMIADIALISQSPIVLIDEIENAGIKKREAIKVLLGRGKIVLIITHDPMLALMTDRRIVMANGGVRGVVKTTTKEVDILKDLIDMDNMSLELRDKIRKGENI